MLCVTALLLAGSAAFVSKATARFSQTGYNIDAGACVSGNISNTNKTCSTSETIQCQFLDNGVAVDAYNSCDGTPPVLGQLLKHS